RTRPQVISCMRHYLILVKTQKHREALTSLLLSTHLLLAVEILGYVNHALPKITRADRVSRFCKTEVETPEHALITCVSSDALVDLRAAFLDQLFNDLPNLRHPRSTIALVAEFAFDVLQIYYAVPM
ncbi:hypothetical protein C8J57DRAFT_1076026, partial [Mycena rebaudengoi]